MAKTAGFFLLTFGVLAGISARPVTETADLPTMTPVELQSNKRVLYPGLEDVAVRSMDRLPEGVGLSLNLVSDMKGFSRFLFSTNGAPFREAAGDRLIIAFTDNHTPDVQQTVTVIRAVSAAGNTSRDYHIDVNYYPRELYANAGQKSPGYVIVQKTDIPIASGRVTDWITDRPSPDDVAFATATWGPALQGAAAPLEKARRLARALMDDLKSHRGIPSDQMSAPPFVQYRRAMSGQDRVWCSNLADIFVHACNCLGVPARTITMIPHGSKGRGYDLLTAEGHATTEVFDADLNRWVWMDLTLQMTGMELPGKGPIQMAQLVSALNDPEKIGGLTAMVYDPDAGTEKRVRVVDSPARDALLNYFQSDHAFTYTRRTAP